MGKEFFNVEKEFLNVGEEFLNVGEEFPCGYLRKTRGFFVKTIGFFVKTIGFFVKTIGFFVFPPPYPRKNQGYVILPKGQPGKDEVADTRYEVKKVGCVWQIIVAVCTFAPLFW